MASFPPRICWIAFALIAVASAACAQSLEPTSAEQRFDELAVRYAPAGDVQQAAFVGTPAQRFSAPAPPPPTASVPTIILPNNGPSIYPSPSGPSSQVEIVLPPSDAWCLPPQEPCRTSSWFASVDFIITQAELTRGEFGSLPDDESLALRVNFGYEDPQDIGIRARLWGFSQDIQAVSDDFKLEAAAFDFDLYKRLFIDDMELVLGGGSSSRWLKLTTLIDDEDTRFRGTGISLFVEGYQPLVHFTKSEIGMVGRARHTLLVGNWNGTTTTMLPGTDRDTPSVSELAWGMEYRRRFGRAEDHQWFASVVAEHQRWDSEWLGEFMATSVGFTGLNISTGVAW